MIAEAANPEWVSVPLVGWSMACALRQVADVHLVTQERNREAILRAGWIPGRDFTAIDSEAIAAPMWKLASRLGGSSGVAWTLMSALSIPSYFWFERLLWRDFSARLRAKEWDIVHRVTPLSPTTPSRIVRHLRDLHIPFIVGPLNGGVPWPKEFARARRQEKEWLSYVRGAYRLVPGYRGMRDDAAALLVGSRDTWKQLGAQWKAKAVYLPENAIPADRFHASQDKPPCAPLRVIFVGRLVPYKGVDMLIEACAELIRSGKVQLEIVGDGPQKTQVQQQIAQQGLGDRVILSGWLNHEGVAKRFRDAHVLGFPSIREFGGGVVLEAMASGVVPIVIDYGGPAELVTPKTGYLVALGSRQSIVCGLRAQLQHLVANPLEIAEKALNCQSRIVTWFTWERKAEQIAAVYAWVLGRAAKPDFGMPFPD